MKRISFFLLTCFAVGVLFHDAAQQAVASGGFVSFFGWSPDGSGRWVQTASGGGIVFGAGATTTDFLASADTKRLYVCGGSTESNSNGACLSLNGNSGPVAGAFSLNGGSGSGSVVVTGTSNPLTLASQGSSGTVVMQTNGATTRWTLNSSGQWVQDATNGGEIVLNNSTASIVRQGTSDATDNKSVKIEGGGGTGATRGAEVFLRGNESSGDGGRLSLSTGSTSGADLQLDVESSNGAITFLTNGGTTQWTIGSGGTFQSKTSFGNDIGWSVQSGANTACNTTCSTGCVLGFDSGSSNLPVACSNAAADVCLCAGAS